MFHVRSTLHPLWCMVGRVYSLTHIASDQSDRTTDPAQRSHTLRFLVFFFFFLCLVHSLVGVRAIQPLLLPLAAGWLRMLMPDAHSHDDIRIHYYLYRVCSFKRAFANIHFNFIFFHKCVFLWLFIYLILIGGESSESISCTTRHWTA